MTYKGRLRKLELFRHEKTQRHLTYLKGGCREGRARFFSLVPSDRMRGSGHKLKCKKFPVNMRKLFSMGVAEPLAQVAQKGFGVSLPGDNQNPSGHGPEQLTLGVPPRAEGLDKVTYRGPFQPTIL